MRKQTLFSQVFFFHVNLYFFELFQMTKFGNLMEINFFLKKDMQVILRGNDSRGRNVILKDE